MSYIKTATERLNLPSDPTYWVEFKKRLTFGDRVVISRALQDAVYESTGESKTAMFRAAVKLRADDLALLPLVIVAWNVDDESGAILPIDAETVKHLADEDAQLIIDRVNELNPRRSAEERLAFRNAGVEHPGRNGGPSTAGSVPVPGSAPVVD